MRHALKIAALSLAALVVWASCTAGTTTSVPALAFYVQNFTNAEMSFAVSVDSDTTGGTAYTVKSGSQATITVDYPCPTQVLFYQIRYADGMTSPDLPFFVGSANTVTQGALPNQQVVGGAVPPAGAYPTFACPGAFQITATSGALNVALATRGTVGSVPVTPTFGGVIFVLTPALTPIVTLR